ncbi:MAG TPA: alpha/beta hydrolase [Actinomycetota bacterium]|nr:alpha/beta hydrolase [Actinomycetota bacterium]
MKETEGSARVNGIDIAYVSVGDGPPVLALHGGPGLGHTYIRPAFDALADRYRVIYPDQRGSGRTPLGDAELLSIDGAISDLEGLCDALGLPRVNVAGHSTSALLALVWAAERPERITSLVAAHPAPPFVNELADRLWAEMERRQTPEDKEELGRIMSSDVFARREPKAVEALFRTMYLPFFTSRALAESLDFGFTEITAANIVGTEERMMEDLERHHPLEALANIQAPTLVLGAELDPSPEEFARLVADKVAGAQYAFIEGANHFSYLDQPERFESMVRSFLDEHAR